MGGERRRDSNRQENDQNSLFICMKLPKNKKGLMSGPICVPAAVINTMTKSHLKRKGFVSSYSLQSIINRSQNRNSQGNLETRTEAEAMEECGLLACSSQLAHSTFLYSLGPLA